MKYLLPLIDEQTIIIAHSLGCLISMRIAEKKKIKKIIFVAAWDYNDLTENHKLFWTSKIDHKKIKNNCKDIVFISSSNEPYAAPRGLVSEMADRFNAKYDIIENAGHFQKEDGFVTLPQILKYLIN